MYICCFSGVDLFSRGIFAAADYFNGVGFFSRKGLLLQMVCASLQDDKYKTPNQSQDMAGFSACNISVRAQSEEGAPAKR